MNKQKLEALKQSALEAGRLMLTALVSYLLTEGVLGFIIDYFFGVKVEPSVKLQVTTALTIILKAVDRALHETGIRTTGLTQF